MKRLLPVITLLAMSFAAYSQPATEIYLFDLKSKKGAFTLDKGKNITNHRGYDNQPYFHPELPLLYYASADSSGRTDIFSYDFSNTKTARVTKTPDREYSPTVTPDQQFISCIVQRDNNAQDLVRYPMGGGAPVVVVNNLTVGYHVWQKNTTLYVFVLGQPTTLRKYSIGTGKDSTIAENVGRSLHKIPYSEALSFVQKTQSGDWFIKQIDELGELSILGPTRPNNEDLAWTPDGKIMMSDGNKLFVMTPGVKDSWKEVTIKAASPLKNISRISIDPTGTLIALVVEE